MQIADGLNSKLHFMYYCYCNGCWLYAGKTEKQIMIWFHWLYQLDQLLIIQTPFVSFSPFLSTIYSMTFVFFPSRRNHNSLFYLFFFLFTQVLVFLSEKKDPRPISEYSYGSRSITFLVGNNSTGSLRVPCARKRIKDFWMWDCCRFYMLDKHSSLSFKLNKKVISNFFNFLYPFI